MKRKQLEEQYTQKKQRIGFGPDVSYDQIGRLVATDEYGEWREVPGFSPNKVIVASLGWIKVSSNGISVENARPRKGWFNTKTRRHHIKVNGVISLYRYKK